MFNTTTDVLEALNAPSRQIGGRAFIAQGSTVTQINNTDNLKSFTIDRVGENGKFFGYGVSQKATVEILDKDRQYKLIDGTKIEIAYEIGGKYLSTYPVFFLEPTETKRDEKTNTITAVAYDALYAATAHTFSEITLNPPYTMADVADKAAQAIGLLGAIYDGASTNFNGLVYEDGANLEGTETLREVLDDIAEATQTIYYVDGMEMLHFVNCYTEPVDTISKSKYFELESGKAYTLASISHTTELGDNIAAGESAGVEQTIKDNDFLSLREDLTSLLDSACSLYDGMTIYGFNCSWRGNPLYEIGDWLEFERKDGTKFTSILVNDSHTYNGGLSAKTSWEYTQTTADNTTPTTLGEAIKETYAKVDKANKQIEMVVSELNGNTEAISSITQTTDTIIARVSAVEEQNKVNDEELSTLKSQVELAITKDALAIEIQKELDNGVNKVATNTGYTFDDTGLTIEKSGSEIKTQITEDGMTVYKESEEVLTANNQGVKAKDLHATTFLIIGNNSRFEDYGSRTGCFWIGG
jgi:hypothetical protein